MSKILQAYRRRDGSAPEVPFAAGLRSVPESAVNWSELFPRPSREQEGEFSQLASALLEYGESAAGGVFCFASSVSGEGTSFVSFNAARLLAREFNRKALWLEANFISPQAKLSHHRGPTFATLLDGTSSASEVAVFDNLAVLPAGDDLASRTDKIAGPRCREVFSTLAQGFDFVLVDCPPILQTIETGYLGAASQGLITVVERRRLKWEIVQHAIEGLAGRNVRVLGAVLNRRRFELPRSIYDRL